MNIEELRSEWEQICEKVKSYPNVDSSPVNAFFARLQPQAMSSGFIMLTTDADFIKNYIETHYLDLIKKALFDIHGTEFTVAIEIDPNQAAAPVVAPREETPDQAAYIEEIEPQQEEEPEETDIEEDEDEQIEELPLKMTFENFVIGDSNNLAFSMAVAVAEQPGKMPGLNPLFIHGKSGLGKTHLLSSIQNYILENTPKLKAVYVDSSDFVNQYTDATIERDRNKYSYRNFRNRYENADVLLIDDVQFFQAKHQTLNILFQIIKDFIDEGKQIVFAADRAPKNIDLDERYISRFSGGMVCAINPPEIDTKLGIIRSFVEEYRIASDVSDFSLPPKIEQYIAETSGSNIRELKGAVSTVVYHMNANPETTLDDVKELLKNHFTGGANKKISISDIQKQVESFYKVSHADLVGNRRSREIVYPRQIAIYLCCEMLALPYQYIGNHFGGRDHSTIMYSKDVVSGKIRESREVQEEIEAIKALVQES